MTAREGVEIVCERGAVATGPADAARAGAAILERGGNAMDAAAAACLACAVLEPQAVDLGGYALAAVVLEGRTGRVWSVDANTLAPAAATPSMFRVLPRRARPHPPTVNEREYDCSVEHDANFYGPLATGVPGFVGGVGVLWERWGCRAWPEIVEPARRLVERGLPWADVRKDIEFKRQAIERFRSTAALLLDGAGELWFRPDLARALERLSDAGWRDFYTGRLGHAIADFVQSQGGILTRADMAAFAPRITEPLTGTYRGAEVHTAIAPNGGFSVLAALAAWEAEPPAVDGPEYWRAMTQALVHMWTARLADSPSSGTGHHGTVHVSAADREGNLVSATISQGGLFGSCLAVPGAGIILAHGMCRFDPHPGRLNSPAPRKRPLNNLCPLLLRLPDRDVAIGARGGRRIVSVSVQLAQRIVDLHASVYAAAAAPRLHTITGDPVEISANFDPAMRAALERSGYRIEVPDEVAGAAHGAELLRPGGAIRAGGNTWAAGI